MLKTLNAERLYVQLGHDGYEGLRIRGIALTAGVHNDVYYSGEEMRKAVKSLEGVKIRVDHSKEVRDIVGVVEKAEYKEEDGKQFIEFEGVIMDEEIARKIRQGLIDSFSVGVDVELENDAGQLVAKDMVFKELSLVTDPADENALLIEILNRKLSKEEFNSILKEVNLMVEKKLAAEIPKGKETNEPEKPVPVQPKDEEPVAAEAEKPKAELQDEEASEDVEELKRLLEEKQKIIDQLQAEIAALKKEQEKTKVETEPEVSTEEMKKEISELRKELEEIKNSGKRKTLAGSVSKREELSYNPLIGYFRKNPLGTKYGLN